MTNPSFFELTLELVSEAETRELGERLAAFLRPGDVVALMGPLGAGKTRLVKALAAALGVSEDAVNSPTFTLIHEYAGRLPVRHCDAYRLQSAAEFSDLGLEELFSEDGVVLVEWADRVAAELPADRLEIRLEPTGRTSRAATLIGRGERGRQLAKALQETCFKVEGPRSGAADVGDQ